MRIWIQLLLSICISLGACRKEAVPTPQTSSSGPAVAEPVAPPQPKPWRIRGKLVGATSARAIVLTDELVSVDLATGEVRATAHTAAEDPVPSFERLLPRLGEEAIETSAVDRLSDLPVYVGGELVVFLRGSKDAVTSVVGLDATTLEEAWVLQVGEKRPLRSCSTVHGVLLIPDAGPARFIDWLGQQHWLREFGEPGEEVTDFACGDEEVSVALGTGAAARLRTFSDTTGDLVAESPDAPTASLDTLTARAPRVERRVVQDGAEVVGTPAGQEL